MDTLLDTELGNEHIEGRIEHTNDLRLADDGAVALRQVGDEDAKVEMSGLLLRELGRVALAVLSISPLDATDREATRTCCTAVRPSQRHRDPC